MTNYPYRMQLVVDPDNPRNVVAAGSVSIYDSADTAHTTLLTLTDPSGVPIPNPITSNANGFTPPFVTTSPEVLWVSGAYTDYFQSYQGMRDEAVAAVAAAEAAAANAGAEAAVVAEAAIGTATDAATAAAASAATAESNASASATAAANAAALVAAPADTAVQTLITAAGSATRGALNATFAKFDGRLIHIGPKTLAGLNATFDAAELMGRGTIVYLPAGVYDVGNGLSMSGRSVVLRGAGAAGTSSNPTGTVFYASTQTGPVIDWTGWVPPTNAFTAKVRHSDFLVRGSGVADPTKANAGMKFAAMSSSTFVDIAVRDTGGPCIDINPTPGNGFYLCDMERLTLNTPVGAKANDVPYFRAIEANGNRFRGIGIRSISTSADVGVSGAVVIAGNASYSGHDNLYDAWWFENLHVPSGGTVVAHANNTNTIRDFQWFDVFKEDGASGTSYFRFTAPAVPNTGGNLLTGVIPGKGTNANDLDMGVDMQQSRNRVHGTKGYRGTNVVIGAGITNIDVDLGGAVSTATDPAVVDNSGSPTNTTRDAYLGVNPARGTRVISGRYYGPANMSPSTSALAAGTLLAIPFYVPNGFTANSIECEVTAVAAGSTIRMGIYTNNRTTDTPDQLLLDAGTVDSATATGVKAIAISQHLDPGLYWLALVAQGGAPTIRSVGNVALPPVASTTFVGTSATAALNCTYMTGVTGALGAWAGANASAGGPKIMVKAA